MRSRAHLGLTMVELLVCLGILAVTLGSVLSIFFAGRELARDGSEAMEAGRIAEGVFEFADSASATKDPLSFGRLSDGTIAVGSITNQNVASFYPRFDPPTYVIDTTIPLVWEARVEVADDASFTSTPPSGLYLVVVSVLYDDDQDGLPTSEDREIGTYYAHLSVR